MNMWRDFCFYFMENLKKYSVTVCMMLLLIYLEIQYTVYIWFKNSSTFLALLLTTVLTLDGDKKWRTNVLM